MIRKLPHNIAGSEIPDMLAVRYWMHQEAEDEWSVIEYLKPFIQGIVLLYYRKCGGRAELDELWQIANIGAHKALRYYDPEKGSYVPYAQFFASGEIRHFIRDRTAMIHVSNQAKILAKNVAEEFERLHSLAEGHAAEIDEVAAEMGLNREMVVEAIRIRAIMQPTQDLESAIELPDTQPSTSHAQSIYDQAYYLRIHGKGLAEIQQAVDEMGCESTIEQITALVSSIDLKIGNNYMGSSNAEFESLELLINNAYAQKSQARTGQKASS